MSEKLFASILYVYGAFLLSLITLSNLMSTAVLQRHSSRTTRDLASIMDLSGLLNTAACVLLIIISFKAKAKIESYMRQHNPNFKMSAFCTFIFNMFYINYSLNKIKND